MEPDQPAEQAPSPPPSNLRPWEDLPFGQGGKRFEGQSPPPPGYIASPPARRSRLGLIIGVIAVVVVVGTVLAGIVGFLLLRHTITAATRQHVPSTARSNSRGPAMPPLPMPPATVTVAGQLVATHSSAVCTKAGGVISIAVDPGQGIAVTLNDDNPPQVQAVALGTVNGLTLAYSRGAAGDSAEVTRDGNTFTIHGTATGVDLTHGMQTVTKPFDIVVACPRL